MTLVTLLNDKVFLLFQAIGYGEAVEFKFRAGSISGTFFQRARSQGQRIQNAAASRRPNDYSVRLWALLRLLIVTHRTRSLYSC